MKDADGLTGKQAAFVRHYTTPGPTMYNGTKSAEEAGYKGEGNTLAAIGYENLRKPHIQRAINRAFRETLQIADLTVDSVVAKLEQHRLLAIRKEDYGAANKALELQGKYLKMFADRVEHVHSVEEATSDELTALLGTLIRSMGGDHGDLDGILAAIGGGQTAGGGEADSRGAHTTH